MQRDATDDLADSIAHDLHNYAAKNPAPYAHIISVFGKLGFRHRGHNVAADFTELQSDAQLEMPCLSSDPKGPDMLDVLTEAMITGSVTAFESHQAERILMAQAKSVPAEQYVARADRIARLRHRASPPFGDEAVCSASRRRICTYTRRRNSTRRLSTSSGNWIPTSRDNVAADFTELQSDAQLENMPAARIRKDPICWTSFTRPSSPVAFRHSRAYRRSEF